MTATPSENPSPPTFEPELARAISTGSSIDVGGLQLDVERVVHAADGHVVARVLDSLGRPRALHLLSTGPGRADRGAASQILMDLASLEGRDQFAAFHGAATTTLQDSHGEELACWALVEEWVSGPTLRELLEGRRERLTVSQFLALVGDVANAIEALRELGLHHGQIDAEHLILWSPPKGGLSASSRFRLVDVTGLHRASSFGWADGDDSEGFIRLDEHPDDDWGGFVGVIVEAFNAFAAARPLTPAELRFQDAMAKVIPTLLDDEPGRGINDPVSLVERLEQAARLAGSDDPEVGPTMPTSPFAYPSTEHITSDRTLIELFADSCPWLPQVSGPAPVILLGPRGCGKSMIFRWLSLRAHLFDTQHIPPDRELAGFYISCSADLQSWLGGLDSDEAVAPVRRELIHFFNLIVAREVLDTLRLISQRPDSAERFGLTSNAQRLMHEYVAVALREPLRVVGWNRMQQCVEMIDEALREAHDALQSRRPLAWTTAESFLGDLSRQLTSRIHYFKQRKIAYLLDDFTDTRLPPPVQRVLNRVIWQRTPAHIFKVTSEKYGSTGLDEVGATADLGRELLIVDAGWEYLRLDDADQVSKALQFTEDLLERRLRFGGYVGTPQQLIGNSDWGDYGTLAKSLRENRVAGRQGHYHGLQCIANLCSGDVHSLLMVYARILREGNVTHDQTDVVPKHVQNRAIVAVSRQLLEMVRTTSPYGPQLYALGTEFGSFVRRVLQEGPLIRSRDREVPPMCPRIEIEGLEYGFAGLEEPQADLARWLVRRSVFIEMEQGRSRHGNVQTVRLQLRRVYLPAFGAALSKNDAEKWRVDQFVAYLKDPKLALAVAWQRRARNAEAAASRAVQSQLFEGDEP